MTVMQNTVVSFPAPAVVSGVETIDLDQLYLSPLNPRQSSVEGEDALLAKSLVACGLVQNLVGLRGPDGRVGIVAGGRRLRALQMAVQERPDLARVPVRIVEDEATALKMASAENSARVAMDAADEIRNFGAMRKTGATVSEIASAFAVTEAHVYRRLKLSDLPEAVLDALKARSISFEQAQAFTVSDDHDKQHEVLDMVLSRNGHYSAHSIREAFLNRAVSSRDRRAVFVGENAYVSAGGGITRDLFSEVSYFLDEDLLDSLFRAKLEEEAEKERIKGWAWVETCFDGWFESHKHPMLRVDRGVFKLPQEQEVRLEELRRIVHGKASVNDVSSFDEADDDAFDEAFECDDAEEEIPDALFAELASLEDAKRKAVPSLEEKALLGLVVLVNGQGAIVAEGPYVRANDLDAAKVAGLISYIPNRLAQHGDEVVAQKSVFSDAMKKDITAIRLHAFQSKLRSNPKLALSLLAFSLSGAWNGTSLFGLRPEHPMNLPTVTDGLAVDAALDPGKDERIEAGTCEEAFAEFCQKSEAEILEVLVAATVRTIHSGFGHSHSGKATGLFEATSKALDVETRSIWTPTQAAFWGRMPASYLDETYKSLTGASDATDHYKAFKGKKKGEKAGLMEKLFTDAAYQKSLKLKAKQIEAISVWMPDPGQ